MLPNISREIQSKKQLTPAQKKAWYKGRYTPDEIKEMQLQLNKTGVRPATATKEEGEAAAFYISEINNMKANDPK